jgi:hypothetical protein
VCIRIVPEPLLRNDSLYTTNLNGFGWFSCCDVMTRAEAVMRISATENITNCPYELERRVACRRCPSFFRNHCRDRAWVRLGICDIPGSRLISPANAMRQVPAPAKTTTSPCVFHLVKGVLRNAGSIRRIPKANATVWQYACTEKTTSSSSTAWFWGPRRNSRLLNLLSSQTHHRLEHFRVILENPPTRELR